MQTVPLKVDPDIQAEASDYALKKVLILGIGNILQKDDGLGVHIIHYIKSSDILLPEEVYAMDGGTAGYDLIPLMAGFEKIVIVDALLAEGPPGSIYKFSADHLAPGSRAFSQHDLGIRQVLDMLALMGECPEVEIIGIVPEDIHTCAIGISDSVLKSLPGAVKQILETVTYTL